MSLWTWLLMGALGHSRPICLLERLQHEPFWDHVPIVESDKQRCSPKSSTLLPVKGGLEILLGSLHWPSLRQYLQPLAYVSYVDAVQHVDRIVWKFPSWRAEGPLHETMTLSDGFNSFWHALQESLVECTSSSCLAAVLLGETVQTAREALARPHEIPSWKSLQAALRQPLPWKAWLETNWAVPLLESFQALLWALGEETAFEREETAWVLRELLTASDCQAVAKRVLTSDLPSKPSFWDRPLLHLLAQCSKHSPQAGPQPSFLGQRHLTHTFCDDGVKSLPLTEDIMLHVHGASAFLEVDSLGRRWLRLELLHFVSSTDGAVRLTVYGHLQRDRKYYAQALTLPLALQQKWHCALESLESDPLQARVASFFGYDAIAYCDFPVEGTFQELVTKDLRPWLLMGQVKEPAPSALRLCPAPQHLPRRYRLAACTQPLHSFAKLEKLAPSLLRDFLDYHSLLGIEHFTIFDADGTLAGPLERYKETAAVEFDYLDHWPKRFGAAHAEEGEQWRPLLFEVEAENHCLWRYRGQADWAVVLHSPDEFLHVPKSPGPNSLRHFLDALEPRSSIAHVELRQILFGGDVQPATTLPGRFRYREEGTEATAAVAHTVIVNVDNVAQAGVHPARPRPSLPSETPLRIVQADPMTDVRVNHYVNALGQERCGRKLCKVLDETALWAEHIFGEIMGPGGLTLCHMSMYELCDMLGFIRFSMFCSTSPISPVPCTAKH